MNRPQLVIMAAGIGSRYGGLKQIDPMGPHGEIIIDYSIYDALQAGFERVVFIIRKHFEQDFRDMIGRNIEARAEVSYVYQELDALPGGLVLPEGRTKPWGTAHAVLCARDRVDANSAVINADDFYGPHTFRALYDFLSTAQDDDVYRYAMVGFELEKTLTEHGHVARGVCTVTPDGSLSSVVERTKIQTFDGEVRFTEDDEHWELIPSGSTVSMNTWGFTPSLYGELEARFVAWFGEHQSEPKAEFFLPSVVNDLLSEGRATVRVLPTDERWYGVTYQEDKPVVKAAIDRYLADGTYPQKLWT